jgi:hypothetical protein
MNEIISIETSTAESIMDALVREATNDRRRETLTRLKAACQVLITKARPIKIKDIEREVVQAHGKDAGPKAQSISNERDRPLGMYHYVMACERERLGMPSQMNKSGRPAKRQDAVESAIHKIKDMDIRSVMFDLHDRCLLAEKELGRAKVLMKTLKPGADIEALISGNGDHQATTSAEALSTEQRVALKALLDALCDNAHLATVGLVNDGRRVKRKTGTSDQLVTMATIETLLPVVGD